MSKIATFFNNFHNSLFKDTQVSLSNRKRKISLVIFYFSAFVVFMTLMSQMPTLSSRGLTKIFQFGWILVLIPMIMLDYRHFLRGFANCLIILLPFLIYCVIAKIRGINSINYSGTTCIFLAMFMVSIGIFYGKYFNLNFIRNIAIFYILGAAIYAGVVYINKLRGYDIDNPIYAFDDKNSAGPIFLTAALLIFIVFKRKNILIKIIEIVAFCYFAAIIVLAKCRATVVFLPIALLFIHLLLPTTKLSKILSRIAFPVFLILCAAAIWFIPALYQKIVVNIIMNGKKSITEAFAGRIEQIRYLMQDLQLVLGNGGYYIDCMPVSFLASYGIVGIVSLLPVAVIPIYAIIKGRKEYNKSFFIIELTILSLLLFNSLLEGYGYFGPGTKVFMLWLLTGYSYYYVIITKKSSFYKLIDKPASLCNKLKPKTFIIALQVFLIAGSGLLIYTKTLSNRFGTSYVGLLPENNKKSDIISLSKSMEISQETNDYIINKGMCTGQKIKFKHTLEPSNAMNGWANWLLGFPEAHHNAVKVDSYTGVVEAIVSEFRSDPWIPTMVQVFFPTCGDTSRYIEFKVYPQKTFNFNDGLIYTKPFKYSFEHKNEIDKKEIIKLNTNHSIKFYYDINYVPDGVSFSYSVSKGSSTSTIDDTGIFKATQPGDYEVVGRITNQSGSLFETNKINIKVEDNPEESFIGVTAIDIQNKETIKDNSYQYQPIEIKPKWNNGNTDPSDKDFDIVVDESKQKFLDYEIDDNKHTITFKNSGTVKLKIKSRNNPNIVSDTIQINVKSNPLIKFICPNYKDWIVVGETIDVVKDMGLSLEFKNGYKKPITEEDLFIPSSKDGRAGNSTGFINGNFTKIKGVCNSSFYYKYIAKIDTTISYDFNLTTNVFTKDDYTKIVNNSGLIVVFIIVTILTPSLLLIDSKKKWIYVLVALSYLLVILGMTILSYSFNSFTLSCLIAFTAAIFFISILKFTLLANKEIKFIDLE